ncbi:MAG: hypothetical protein Q9162_000434 [Coniocarpon cinnabarinum]
MGPKSKKQVMSLGNFLTDQSMGSWADQMEDEPLPSSGVLKRGFHREPRPELPLPTAPPYTAHLGNLSFDVTQGDVEDFFADCQVTSVRIVEDKIDRRPKGFGYVEFGTLDGLKQALTKNGASFQNRSVKISVADPPKDRVEQRSFDDWSRKGPLPELPGNNRRVSQGPPGRGFDNRSDAGSERGGGFGMERGGSRRGPLSFEGDGKNRDFGNWERKGPPTPIDHAPPSREGRPSRVMDRSFERRPSPAAQWEGRSQDSGSRPRPPPPERQPTAAEMDNQWRARMKPDAPPASDKPSASPTPEASAPTSPAAAPATLATRPKLNLQKRTVSEVPTEITVSSGGDSRSSSIFGAAKPIDTASKEAAVAEKRAAARKAKEEEDKARMEKEKTEKAARVEEKKARRESVPSTPTGAAHQENGANGKVKEQQNGEKKEERAPGARYEILRRNGNEGEEENGDATSGQMEDNADGEIIDDKNVKPKEVVRDMTTNEQTTPSAEAMEEEGWNTVSGSKDKRGHRKRNSMAASRALAS